MLEGSRIMYDMKFYSNEDTNEVTEISSIPMKIFQQSLNA